MLVRINDDIALDMLMDRVCHWTDDYTVSSLYETMYANYICSGVFDN